MIKIKARRQSGLKLLKNDTERRNGRTSAFSSFGKRKLYQAEALQIKSRQRDEEYDESDFAHERVADVETKAAAEISKAAMKVAGKVKRPRTREAAGKRSSVRRTGNAETVKQAADKARVSFQRNTYVKSAISAGNVRARNIASLKRKRMRRKMLQNRKIMGKVCAFGAVFLAIFVCIFSGVTGGVMSSIDMGKGQDNITSAYLYLGTLEAGQGKLSSRGVTIDAEPMMAYMIAEYGIVSEFDETQRQQFLKVYNAINAQGCRSNTDKFFNAFYESIFSSNAGYETYKKLMAEGLYKDFKTMGSPFIGRDWVSKISSSWGWRIHPKSGTLKLHKGLDIAMPGGTPINAICSGTVISAGWRGGYGNCVIVHYVNGDTQLSILYAHMSSISVRSGMQIGEGDVVGRVGTTGYSTGNHLHIEIMAGAYSSDITKLFYPRIYMTE